MMFHLFSYVDKQYLYIVVLRMTLFVQPKYVNYHCTIVDYRIYRQPRSVAWRVRCKYWTCLGTI